MRSRASSLAAAFDFIKYLGESGDDRRYPGFVDPVVDDETERAVLSRIHEDAALPHNLNQPVARIGRKPAGIHAEKHHIDLDAGHVHGDAPDPRQGESEDTGVLVVLGETFPHFPEGQKACRGEDARLAHPAAHGLSPGTRLVDEVGATREHGADGRAETLG